jgi:hypothetical protein
MQKAATQRHNTACPNAARSRQRDTNDNKTTEMGSAFHTHAQVAAATGP